MAIRLLTTADAPLIQATLDGLAPGYHIDAAQLFVPPPAGDRLIIVGDTAPTVAVFCRLVHYQIPPVSLAVQLALMPPLLAALLSASNGWSTQVTHFGPLSASDPALTASRLPHLATALAAIVSKAPANIRATLQSRPVWANFDGVSAADAAALVAMMLTRFTGAGHDGRYIWWRLSDAAAAVSGLAVPV